MWLKEKKKEIKTERVYTWLIKEEKLRDNTQKKRAINSPRKEIRNLGKMDVLLHKVKNNLQQF